jgi:predicted RNA-binding protein (virulence factor B family)
MFHLGQYQILKVDEISDFGYFLTNPEAPEPDPDVEVTEDERRARRILLPKRLTPKVPKPGDLLRVFVYKDNEERFTATLQEPLITLGGFARLEARNVDERGAWLKWGLDKDLFVPYREQNIQMVEGGKYLVHLYVDDKTDRLAATARIERLLQNQDLTVEEGQEVDLIVWRKTDLGYNVIINNQHKGLVYHNDIFEPVSIGEQRKGYIQTVREDGNLDVTLRPVGYLKIEPNAEKILAALEKAGGILLLHDKSDPDDIRQELHMSKKTFKQAIGRLYKEGVITITETHIERVAGTK